ncbi:MAG: divalent-cation tolerance protein CutA [Thermoplasmatales archaeon]|nr:divalent-cation tolerance protein CutA [Thermoplasmatales archaeon]
MVSIIYSTTGSVEEARKIARILVEEKLVACVNIIPKIESIYRWQGKIEEDNECILLAKTTDKNVDKTIQRIKELHSYDVPDIVSFPITKGLKGYLDWIKDETI